MRNDTQCWLVEMQEEGKTLMAVALLVTQSYPAADHRFELLQADDMAVNSAFTMFPYENESQLVLQRFHSNLLQDYKQHMTVAHLH